MHHALRRDLSRASWWYRSHIFSSSIHTSSIPRWKWLSLMRVANITCPLEYFMYHWCNSRILVGSMSINSGHIRGCLITNGFLPAPGWIAISSPWSWPFVRRVSSTNWAVASSSFESTFRGGDRLVGLFSDLGHYLVFSMVTLLLPCLCDRAAVVR